MSASLPQQQLSVQSSGPRSLSNKVSSMRFMQRAQEKSQPMNTQQMNQANNTSKTTQQAASEPPKPSIQAAASSAKPVIISAARREVSTEPASVQSSLGRRSFGSFNKHLEPQTSTADPSAESFDAFFE